MRRQILIEELDEVHSECERLLQTGYTMNGKWTLGQMCRHLRLTIDANVDGYPRWMTIVGFPIRLFARQLMLPKLLRGQSPAGLPTAPAYVPPSGLDDANEVALLRSSIERYLKHRDRLHPHPGFGRLTPDLFDRFHAAHASHHLSFLDPKAA
ncbi:MAG: DUF1569 domain-containing protein [Planctomycetota bacterium]